jgi:hypothetical protein
MALLSLFTFVSSQLFVLNSSPSSAHLHIREVHLRVLLLELLEYIQLLLLVARGLAGLLLALIEHHLLHHSSRFTVEVAELAVLGRDLAGVDLGRRGDDVRPPLHLIRLVQVDLEVFAGGGWGECPGGLVDADAVGELALWLMSLEQGLVGWTGRRRTYIYERLLALDASLERIPANLDIQILALVLCLDADCDVEVLDRLRPFVRQGGLLGLFLLACLGVGLFALFWGR